MKINIKGNAVTPDAIAGALKSCERDFNVRIKNATIYVRFQDENGEIVDLSIENTPIEREYTFNVDTHFGNAKNIIVSKEDDEPISAKEMGIHIEKVLKRQLTSTEYSILTEIAQEMELSETEFKEALYYTANKTSYFNLQYFKKVLQTKHRNM